MAGGQDNERMLLKKGRRHTQGQAQDLRHGLQLRPVVSLPTWQKGMPEFLRIHRRILQRFMLISKYRKEIMVWRSLTAILYIYSLLHF